MDIGYEYADIITVYSISIYQSSLYAGYHLFKNMFKHVANMYARRVQAFIYLVCIQRY